jgi:hypothetical protein
LNFNLSVHGAQWLTHRRRGEHLRRQTRTLLKSLLNFKHPTEISTE